MERKIKRQRRSGQTLIEGVCGLVILVLVLVLITAFGVDIYTYAAESARLQVVADETAKRVNDLYFWYGAKRPKFQRFKKRDGSGSTTLTGTGIDGGTHSISESQSEAISYARSLAAQLGLPATALDVRFSNPVETDYFEYTKVLIVTKIKVPFTVDALFPSVLPITATGVSVQATAPPPAFIRLGYNLITGDTINPTDTGDVTQVCILPSFGFETDLPSETNMATLGGSTSNGDVVANSPNDLYCGWNGLNVEAVLEDDGTIKPRIKGTPPLTKNKLGGHTWYFDKTPPEVLDPNQRLQ